MSCEVGGGAGRAIFGIVTSWMCKSCQRYVSVMREIPSKKTKKKLCFTSRDQRPLKHKKKCDKVWHGCPPKIWDTTVSKPSLPNFMLTLTWAAQCLFSMLILAWLLIERELSSLPSIISAPARDWQVIDRWSRPCNNTWPLHCVIFMILSGNRTFGRL